MTQEMISTTSKNYAQALMDIATEHNSFEELEKQIEEVSQTLDSSNDLQIVMSNSSISASKKIEILDEIFKDKIDITLLNFLKILVEKNRFNEFKSIKLAFIEMVEKHSNKKTVEVISPITLNFENKTNVLFKLEHKLGCEIHPIWSVDESLIAGLVFKFDDYTIDTSIRTKLENLSKNINR